MCNFQSDFKIKVFIIIINNNNMFAVGNDKTIIYFLTACHVQAIFPFKLDEGNILLAAF